MELEVEENLLDDTLPEGPEGLDEQGMVDYEEITKALVILSDSYAKNQKSRAELKIAVTKADSAIELYKANIADAISLEKGPDDKLLFSNVERRQNELLRRLDKDEDFSTINSALIEKKKALFEVEANVTILEFKCRNFRSVLECRPEFDPITIKYANWLKKTIEVQR